LQTTDIILWNYL